MANKSETLLNPLTESSNINLPLIKADNLGVQYKGVPKKGDDFKSIVHNFIKGQKENRGFWALKDVSFTAFPGDVLGVIGANGAGKTTLCRAILGLMRPDTGNIQVRGEVSSLLSLGTGFNKELSGRENIILNGMMLGLSRKQLHELLPSITEFSGLGHFLYHPIKHYSSGMKARLGFSIASALEAEVLVIDEVLGTGDMEFKERAVAKMQELVSKSKMVVVVTHDIEFVEENCTTTLWLDKGNVAAQGNTNEVVALYKKSSAEKKRPKKKRIINLRETRTKIGSHKTIEVKNLGVKFQLGKKPFWALKGLDLTVREKEIVGIIGHNGAGKTTLCRTLAGLYKPDEGRVHIKGEITALLSFGAGFNSQLTGSDNIYLNGMMLGIPKNNIRELEYDIVEFAELEEFIHKPIKDYSRGMKSRLGFSIAAMLKPDIFIVDEALSAGDISFREKAAIRMQEMLEDAKSVLIVTHNMGIVEKVCTRAIWLQEGKIQYDGDPKKAVSLYRKVVRERKMTKYTSLV